MLWTRRALLRRAGTLAAAMAMAPLTNLGYLLANTSDLPEGTAPTDADQPPAPLGRVATWGVEIRTEPKRQAKLVRIARRDEVLVLRGQTTGDALMRHNPVWFKVDEGWAYSSWIQPVHEQFQNPEPELASQHFWGEITVPFTDSRIRPDSNAGRMMRLYYSSVFRVVGAVVGSDGQWWYQIRDGIVYGNWGPYIPAAHLRRFKPEELSPIRPELDPAMKRIEVNIAKQVVTAYEGDTPVMTTRTATGFGPFQTPRGTFRIIRKRASSRMTGGEGDDFYDLPGVPFPSYFTVSAVALHGTYWHNDYGRQRSHGCVNVPSPIARWIWRWTLPVMSYEEVEIRVRDPNATRVIVI
ncbi:MAG: L,D-transpeptidase [Anaerolineae bacterium]|nr:L,D-transpeptidase [Thermoflexales bacterium]MDW8396833.1 L,D-transpeptidase [Anaerolineae bacterium]